MATGSDLIVNNGNKLMVKKTDVVWNYVGTVASMASNFVLIPLLVVFLSNEEIGLWYVFVAFAGFAQLLEFGFTGTLSRNILYCLSGARKLSKQGCDYESVEPGVDWHLLLVIFKTSKIIYAVLGIAALLLAGTIGTAYIAAITDGFAVSWSMQAWGVFVVSIFTNLYFLYCLTFLRGVGDVAGENKAKTLARISQLVLTALLLVAGFGLLAAAIGYLAYSVVMRFLANMAFRGHSNIHSAIKRETSSITKLEYRNVLTTISFVAWRDGVVSLAWYGATQATSLLSSAFFGLTETATYSVMIQFANALYNLSSADMRSCLPMFQSAYVRNDIKVQRLALKRGISCYVVLYALGAVVSAVFVLPVLTLIRNDFICDQALFVGISFYYFLMNQHSLFCNIIVGMNEIPYFKAYFISTCAGLFLSMLLCAGFGMGPWGLVLGQAIPQLLYNNWHWPRFVLQRVGIGYFDAIFSGCAWWFRKIRRVGKIECTK
mgnify:FL=1|jgi:O-antigen/teichoic acid export membrane protein